MIRQALLIALAAASISCTTAPERVSFSEVKADNESLKVETKWVDYSLSALPSIDMCNDMVCMSQEDFKQSETDKIALQKLREVDQQVIKRIESINNKNVDTLTAAEMEAHREREARIYTENALEREKASNWIKTWGERIGFGLLLCLVGGKCI